MKNDHLFEESKKIIPGGVHSPVRSFKGLESSPIFMKRGSGSKIYDVNDKEYIDFCMSFGPLILGHAKKEIIESLEGALKRGLTFGACEPYSLELAKLVLEKISFMDQIRFVNSGTEAVMTAIRIARGHTNRSKVLKFNGCYHGHVDSMLIASGSGLAGEGNASSAGIPDGIVENTLVCDLDDENKVEEIFKKHGSEIAAIIIEPLPANYGLLHQRRDFLDFLRKITHKYKSLLIFDEVISGFRVHKQGMAGKLGIIPDLITYGKIIGGGMPVGAIAGKRNIMEVLAPMGPVYQAGTLSANPMAMIAGLETMKFLDEDFYERLFETTKKVVSIFHDYFLHKKINLSVVYETGLFWLTPNKNIRRNSDIPNNIGLQFKNVFHDLSSKGIYLAPNAYEVGFISSAHENTLEELKKRLWS